MRRKPVENGTQPQLHGGIVELENPELLNFQENCLLPVERFSSAQLISSGHRVIVTQRSRFKDQRSGFNPQPLLLVSVFEQDTLLFTVRDGFKPSPTCTHHGQSQSFWACANCIIFGAFLKVTCPDCKFCQIKFLFVVNSISPFRL